MFELHPWGPSKRCCNNDVLVQELLKHYAKAWASPKRKGSSKKTSSNVLFEALAPDIQVKPVPL